ncbi:MAG: hypothetical protein ACON4G_07995 [Candidatus Puniceispirillaceae bacterium]
MTHDIVQFTPDDGKTRNITVSPQQLTLPETITEIEIALFDGADPHSGNEIPKSKLPLTKLILPVDPQEIAAQSPIEAPKETPEAPEQPPETPEQPSEAPSETTGAVQQENAPVAPVAASQPPPTPELPNTPILPIVPIAQAQDPVPAGKTDLTPADNTGKDVIDGSSHTSDVVTNGGRGRDQITDGQGDDDIEGALGRDTISLANGGADKIYYQIEFVSGVGRIRATDGQDKITGFTLGEDSLIFYSFNAFDNFTAFAILGILQQGLVTATTTTTTVGSGTDEAVHAKGITFTFPLSGKTATGCSAGRKLIIEFDETELLSPLWQR